MFVIKVLVQLNDGSFDSLPIAKYGDVEWDEKEPQVRQWKTIDEAHAFAELNLPGMNYVIEEPFERNAELDEIIHTHYICTGCNTTPCDCSEEIMSNTGSLK